MNVRHFALLLCAVFLVSSMRCLSGACIPGGPDPDAFRHWRPTLPSRPMLLGLGYGQGKLVAVGNGIYYSTNAAAWLQAAAGGGGVLWSVTYADDLFVAVGRESRAVMTSSNGIDWTVRLSRPTPFDLFAVAYGNGIFVAGGTGFWISTDRGLSWNPAPVSLGFVCQGLFFGEGKFVATGTRVDTTVHGITAVSTNGIDWSVTAHPATSSLLGGTWHKGRFFAVGGGGAILVSDDAVNWTPVPTPAVSSLSAITAHDDQYVAVGGNVVLGSTNGLDWEVIRSIESTNTFRDVIVAGNTFAAVYEASPTSESTVYLSDPLICTLPFFLAQPSDAEQRIELATNLSAKAEGSSPIAYQWQRNGVDIPGAIASQLVLDPLERGHEGIYRVIARNHVGETASSEAVLRVGLPARVLVAPVSQAVPPGSTITFSALIEGTPPITNRWRKPGSIMVTQVLHAATTFLRVENVQPADAGTYGIWPVNRYGQGIPSPATLTVAADADMDGLPDDWEQQHGVTDPAEDSDSDGMTNLQEYQAGTDPRDTQSFLKVERIDLAPDSAAVVLRFLARSNRTYTVQSIQQVTSSPWQRVLDVAASSADRMVTVTNQLAGGEAYFRLTTPRAE